MSGSLEELLGLRPRSGAADWSQAENSLGMTLPGDYKAFAAAHGAGWSTSISPSVH
ncbi:SMI1/KNR4 family protein [Actinoplanes sp. NPDC049596]|uniref:SMI1/KNR4 family protein n=1 Tax=unclassified Actinoplanes TaxID=2626549 RepID=UPI003426D635